MHINPKKSFPTLAKRLMAMLFFFLTIFLGVVGLSLNENTETAVPAVFILGDSILDVGTNNFLKDSKARADMHFYGIDLAKKTPTGRFSNGFNTADRIVKLLGFNESPPAYLYQLNNDTQNFNSDVLKGVNFASGGSGILYQTGKQIHNTVVPMADQIQQFERVRGNIPQYPNDSEDRIHKSLFLISVGSNDIIEFVLFNASKDPNNLTLVLEFMHNLVNNYQGHLKNLLDLGARKFGILSVPAIGCVPILSAIANQTTHCVEEINTIARFFYVAVDSMLQKLSAECPDMKYSFGDSYNITYYMINNAGPVNLDNVTSACCGNQTFLINGSLVGVPCSPEANVCDNRTNFLFWDQYHPTEYASQIAAISLYNGGTDFVTPMNFSLLVQN